MSQKEKIKFRKEERQRVISELESLFDVKLTPKIGEKFLIGNDGSYFCLCGGVGDWHGISKEVVAFCKSEKFSSEKSYIVFARLLMSQIKLYIGQLKPLVDNIDKLSQTSAAYTFDIKVMEDRVSLKQIPGYYLQKLGDIPYEFEMAFKTASPEARKKILEILEKAGVL